MKIAIAGKGGVGKTTIAACLARLLGREGRKVFAIDADPNSNLAISLGFTPSESETFTPIIEMKSLIEERTGAKPGSMGAFFSLNPKVDDIPDRFKREIEGVQFLLVGSFKEPSSGCYCPENALLKALLMNLILARDETVILDMEAGFEHLTRGTAQAFDAMIIVIEPSVRTIITAKRIERLAEKTGIKNIFYIANKIRDEADKSFIERESKRNKMLGHISMSNAVLEADREGRSPFDTNPTLVDEIGMIKAALFERLNP